MICLEQIRGAHMVLDDISVLINTAKLKRSAKIRCFEDIRPLIPDRGTKKEAMPSADVSRRILDIKRAPFFVIKRLGWSTDKRAVYQNLRPTGPAPGS